MNVYKLIIVLSISCALQSLHAMHYETAKIATALSAAAAGGIVGAMLFDDISMDNGKKRQLTAFGKVAGASLVTGLCCRRFFWNWTPRGLLSRATRRINSLDQNLIDITQKKLTQTELFDAVNHRYIKEHLPLMSAFKDIKILHEEFSDIRYLLREAQQCSVTEAVVKQECEERIDTLDYFSGIEESLAALKSHPDFLKQFKAQQLKDTADAAESAATSASINATANSINAAANMTRRH